MIPYGKHSIDDNDIAAVVDVLENQFLTQGEQVPLFEKALADYCGASYAVAVNSGTSALHIACLALGVSKGDKVWTSPISFVASANCALYCGATVDFVDINPVTRNMCPQRLAEKLTWAKKNNCLPKAIVVVHFAGLSCDMQTIRELTQPYEIAIIEDACHALGGTYQHKPIGNCEYSDLCVMSFHPVKAITTAEGGAVLGRCQELQKKLVQFAKHGITRDPSLMTGESEGPWYYQQIELGFNYRLSDLQAALGLSQLTRLDSFIAARVEQAQRYHHALESLPVVLPPASEESAWHLYPIALTKHDRASVFKQLQSDGIGVNVHYIPIHLQPYYRELGFTTGDYPFAEQFYTHAISLPIFPTLKKAEQEQVVASIRRSFNTSTEKALPR